MKTKCQKVSQGIPHGSHGWGNQVTGDIYDCDGFTLLSVGNPGEP